jgi:hypothetical protein
MSDDSDTTYEIDPIEGYCMSCRDTVEIENPRAVWTRKGQPATRGECSQCGGTVFRMGKTDLHDETNRPEPVEVRDATDKRTAPKLTRDAVYINYSQNDKAFAKQLAADLEKSGCATWLHDTPQQDVNWSGGVHPALTECEYMLVVLSEAALEDESVQKAWQFFREQRKRILVAQIESVAPPDDLRRAPRFDFDNAYKKSLREALYDINTH